MRKIKVTKSFDVKKYDNKKKIIVYGASSYGELAFYMLKKCGIIPNYFCDRSVTVEKFFGVKVIRPKDVVLFKDEIFIIASADYFHEIHKTLEEKGCNNIYDMEWLFNEVQVEEKVLTKRSRDMLKNKRNYIDVIYQNQECINFTRVQFVVSERCSLKCKDCTHLMQYYKNPENIDIKKYKSSFDRLLSVTDSISEIRILGGEPFMNPEMYKIIDWYAEDERINSFRVYTNGTIIPNETVLNSLIGDNVQVRISDYEINKQKIENLIEVLEKKGVSYYVTPYSDWQNPGDLHFRNHSIEKMKDIFSRCYERNCITFYRGQLHRCPRSAHAMQLRAMPNVKDDYIDLFNWCEDDEMLKKYINNFLQRNYIEACNYCDGPNRNTQHIPAAIQIQKPRQYSIIREDS